MPREGRPELKQIVHRRCRVCEWEADQIEPVGVQFDCPWCHAPTSIARSRLGRPGTTVRPKNPNAAALGRLGGLKGGPARAARLTPRERRESARKAALARWSKKGVMGRTAQRGGQATS
jgi:pyruvate-formate lyase-activating enzyme